MYPQVCVFICRGVCVRVETLNPDREPLPPNQEHGSEE